MADESPSCQPVPGFVSDSTSFSLAYTLFVC